MKFRKSRKQAGMAMAAMIAALLPGGAPPQERGGVLEQAFAWVQSLWEVMDVGPHIDPDGLTVTGPQPTSNDGSDVGWHIDPDGLTAASPQPKSDDGADVGWHIDPNG